MSQVASRKSYGAEDVQRALYWLALFQGNYRRASNQLRAQGHPVPAKTIENWHKKDPVRYQAVREGAVAEVHSLLAGEFEDVARASLELQNELLDETRRQLQAGEIKNADSAARNVATVGGIAAQHIRPMRDMPSRVVEVRDVAEILRSLEAKLPKSIDATATEIT